MQLPYFQTNVKELSWVQTKWKAILDPLLALPTSQSTILKNITLANGTTVVNHKLGRKLQGWSIVRQRAKASIYDQQDSNQTPDLTLVLVSDAGVMVDIEVF